MTAAELTFLPDRRLAFDNLNARTNSEGIRAVVNTLQRPPNSHRYPARRPRRRNAQRG